MSALTIEDPAYFARLAEREGAHWWPFAMWQIASGLLDSCLRGRSGLHALDVGCGAGGTMRRLAIRPEIAHVAGIDPSAEALTHAEGLEVAVGDALDLPYPDCSLDLVCSFDVLQHLPPGGDVIAFEEMFRVLRPDGVVLMRTNGEGLWPDRAKADRPYNLRTLRGLAVGSGFEILASTYVNALPSIATEILGRIRPYRSFGNPQGRGLQHRPSHPTRDRIMRTIGTIEAFVITKLSMTMPVGHSCILLARKIEENRP